MRSFRGLVVVSCLALGAGALGAQDPPAPSPWRAAHLAAGHAYEAAEEQLAHGTAGVEELALWSGRIVEAGVRAGGDEAALRRAHLERMQGLLDQARRRQEVGAASVMEVRVAEYHVAYAEALVAPR